MSGWQHPGHLSYARRIAAFVTRENWHRGTPIVIHNDPQLALYLGQKFSELNVTHHFHNQLKINGPFKQVMSRRVVRYSAVSRFTADWIEKRYALPKASISVVYGGVDCDIFRPASSEIHSTPTLNFTGRTGIEKSADLLLEAALLLRREHPGLPFSVQIVGSNAWGGYIEDKYQARLGSLRSQLEQNRVNVRCTGHIDRSGIAAEFRRAHIHVVPSRWDEPFGLTTLEGMASGLATVVSNTGGSPEVVGMAGRLFERDNAEDLAHQLRPWLEDPEERKHWATRAREHALEFTWHRTWQNMQKVAA